MGLDNWRPKLKISEHRKRREFGEYAKSIRLNNGFSIAEMAEVLFVSVDLIIRIENGKVSPDAPNLQEKLKNISKRKSLIIS